MKLGSDISTIYTTWNSLTPNEQRNLATIDTITTILNIAIKQEHKAQKLGRPRKPLPHNFSDLYQRYLDGESISSLAKECPSISESTLRLRIYERQQLGNSK